MKTPHTASTQQQQQLAVAVSSKLLFLRTMKALTGADWWAGFRVRAALAA